MSTTLKSKRIVRGSIIGAALAALLSLVLITPNTGAYFSADGEGSGKTSTATLTLALGTPNDTDHSTFSLSYDNLAPGQHIDRQFTVTNTGSIPATIHIKSTQSGATNAGDITGADWQLFKKGIVGYTNQIPSNAALNADVGVINPGQTRTFTLRISLDAAAQNNWQGVTTNSRVFVTLDQVH